MNILQYYGIDWIAGILVVVALWLIGNKNKYGFILSMIASCLWVVFAFIAESIPIGITNVIFFLLHARVFMKWRKK